MRSSWLLVMNNSLAKVLFALTLFAAGLGAGYLFGSGTLASKPRQTQLELSITDGGVYRVRKAVDGDTVMLENGLMVRYHGVNTPELGHFVKDAAPLAKEAAARNIELVEGKRIRLRLAREPLDQHGRIIAHVDLVAEGAAPAAETEVGALMIKEGLAKVMGMGLSKEEYVALKKLEEDARTAKAGIWGLEEQLRAAARKPYCATDGGKVYHLALCPSARNIHAKNLHEYDTVEQAEAAGLQPCSKCVAK